MPLRVLQLSGRADHGGGPQHLDDLVAALPPGVECLVACPAGPWCGRWAVRLGAERMLPLPHRRFTPAALGRLAREVRRHGIDLLHSHGSAAGAFARPLALALGLPCVHTFHGLAPRGGLRPGLLALAEGLLGLATSRAICVSAGELACARARWPHLASRLVLVPNGIAVPEVLPERPPRRGPFTVLSFTRANRQKRPELARAIAPALPGALLRLVGEGLPQLPWAGESGLDCRLPSGEPEALLAEADAYLSTSRWEGLPLAILEAWRAGVPVVASDVVGNRDLIEDGVTGLLYPEGDASAGAAAVERLRRDAALADRLREQAFIRLRRDHRREDMAARIAGIYRRLIDR